MIMAAATLANLRFHGPATEYLRQAVAGGLAALDGETDRALTAYETALAGCRSLGLRWDEALTGIDMATLLDPALAVVRAAAESSREILTELRARPYLERLELALGQGAPSSAGRESLAPASSYDGQAGATRA